MIVELIHDALALAACYWLWRAWRTWFGGADRRVAWIVAAGFLLRAFIGEALFWISYLRLPIARSLQLGDGVWFFAVDGLGYMAYADELVRRGLMAIVVLPGYYPSHAYVQILSTFVAMLGQVSSVALFLNCAAYLATCAMIVRLQPRVNGAVLFTLAAVAFGPGTLIWSLQPLKDTLFQFLIAALVFACARWQERPRLGAAVAIAVTTFALSGIRWYFGAIVWIACGLFFVIAALRTPHRGRVLLVALAIFVVLSQAVRIGGAGDVRGVVDRLLDPRRTVAALQQPSQVTRVIVVAREGFDRASGATTIAPGPALVQPAPTITARVVSGGTATFLPRALGQALGLIRVGGGRGLWLVAELDTLAFDAVLLFAIVYVARSRRRVTPLFVFVLLVLVATAGPMIYTVNNFGTLFRLREMLYFLAALLPVTLAPETSP